MACIASRSAFTLCAAIVTYYRLYNILYLLGIIALIPVISWLYIMFISPRNTGIEVLGDKIWWKSLRPVHTILWALFAWFAINANDFAWIVLLIDTLLGCAAFLYHHWTAGNFPKLFHIEP